MSVELKRENGDELISESLANEREKRDELNLEIMANSAALSTAEEEDAKMQKINNLLKMIEAQVSKFLLLDRFNIVLDIIDMIKFTFSITSPPYKELVLGNFGAHFITIKILLKASISNNQIAQEACREGSSWGNPKENIGSMDGQDNFQNCGWKRCWRKREAANKLVLKLNKKGAGKVSTALHNFFLLKSS